MGGFFFPTMLAATGLPAVGALLVGLLTVALVIGAIWAPKTQGKTLQEIEVERYGTPLSPELGGTPSGTDLAAPRPVTHTPA